MEKRKTYLFRRKGNGEHFLHPEPNPTLHLPASFVGEPKLSGNATKFLMLVDATDHLAGNTACREALNDVLTACMNCRAKK